MKTQLVIFGITGDLAGRKLLPALRSIIKTGNYNDLSIVGISRRDVDVSELLKNQPELTNITTIHTLDLTDREAYSELKTALEATGADQTLFYLSVPPGAAADIVDFVGQAGMNTPQYKVLFEKPFGFDLSSAEEFIERTARYFSEEQLYRIDHYMAKEISNELIALRHNADTHHHHWGAENVSSVEIVASEKIDIEGRVHFYEQTGALRDFVQGHLLQLLSLITLDPTKQGKLSDKRLAALQAIEPATPHNSKRAQYEGYGAEVGNEATQTETFVWIWLKSNDPRWQGVDFTLATGKALNEKRSYIRIQYKDGSEDVFEELPITNPEDGRLDAYERVLIDAINDKDDIFITSEEVVRSWEILDELQGVWALDNAAFTKYPKGASIEQIINS